MCVNFERTNENHGRCLIGIVGGFYEKKYESNRCSIDGIDGLLALVRIVRVVLGYPRMLVIRRTGIRLVFVPSFRIAILHLN